ncbi:probable polygalacturonase [Tanacetum coccineum]
MSGGIQDVRAEDIVAIDSESGVRIKTGVGRGGFVKDIYVKGLTMKTMKWAFWMTGNYGSHTDDKWHPNAIPIIQYINYRDMVAENVTMAARLEGVIRLLGYVYQIDVTPQSCAALPVQGGKACDFPPDKLPIEDVKVQLCSFKANYM